MKIQYFLIVLFSLFLLINFYTFLNREQIPHFKADDLEDTPPGPLTPLIRKLHGFNSKRIHPFFTEVYTDIEKEAPISTNTYAEEIKKEFLHAWKGYSTFAWGHDEFKPISRTFKDWVNGGMGLTIVDALDTVIIMGLKDETRKAIDWIKNNLNFNRNEFVSLFETTIRFLGGLLSAYEMTGERILLEKAIDLGNRLLRGYETGTGIPYCNINLQNGQKINPDWNGRNSVLSEFGTVQLEMRKLSQLSGDPKYKDAVERVDKYLQDHPPRNDGLYVTMINPETGQWNGDHVTLGAWGDSYYEYLLKQWILTKDQKYRVLYDQAVEGIFSKLVYKSQGNTFITEHRGGSQVLKMDHLVCFVGGMLALGAHGPTKERDMQLAKEVTETCYKMYKNTPLGLSPETVTFNSNGFNPGVLTYLQRPEAVESIFILYRLTKDVKYQKWAYEIFQSIKKVCRVEHGYSGLANIYQEHTKDDFQQSFFLAETLKYLYLTFTDDIDLNEWVINTEAHPLKIMH